MAWVLFHGIVGVGVGFKVWFGPPFPWTALPWTAQIEFRSVVCVCVSRVVKMAWVLSSRSRGCLHVWNFGFKVWF